MFLDISGFTLMTQQLMQNGKEGVEILNSILTTIFEPVIHAVYRRGGMITGFAGDAFTAVFQSTDSLSSEVKGCYAADDILRIIAEIGKQNTRFGEFDLSIKIGLASGEIQWGIIGTDSSSTYYFRGAAINRCAEAEHACAKMQVVLHNSMINRISESFFTSALNESFSYLNNFRIPEPQDQKHAATEVESKLLSQFLPQAVIDYRSEGEFRDIVSLFLSFKERESHEELNEIAHVILSELERYGGYFKSIDFGDKGCNSLIVFGAPVTWENNIERAINFAEKLRNKLKGNLRAGITFGTAFSGFVGSELRKGYDVIGDVINLSARFMMKADWDEVFIDKNILRTAERFYRIESLAPMSFKGFSDKIPVYKLLKRKAEHSDNRYYGNMIGREKEIDELTKLIQPLKDGKFGGIVYVYGHAGIGKSRLIDHLKQHQNIQLYTFQCDSILRQSLNPFIYFFNSYFQQNGESSLQKRKKLFESIYDELIVTAEKGKKKELHRIRSIIGSVIGLKWDGSIYERIPVQDRPAAIETAIYEFILYLCDDAPLLLHIEDIHWIDEDSKAVFDILIRNLHNTPCVFIATGRYFDDGSKPVLISDSRMPVNEILLDQLSADSIEDLIKQNLGGAPDETLSEFIRNRTEGNPFYTEQFCLYLQEHNLLQETKGKFCLINENVEVPKEINSILIARVDRLSAELKQAIQIASVLGREFELQVLENIISLLESIGEQLDIATIHTTVADVEKQRIWSSVNEIKYIFSHALMREAVYEMQLKNRLRNLHKLAGDTIIKLFPNEKDKFADIAHHYVRAEFWSEARKYCIETADYFGHSFKCDESLTYLQMALDICMKTLAKDHEEVALVYDKIGGTYELTGNFEQSMRYLKLGNAIWLEKYGEEHPQSARSFSKLGTIYESIGKYDKALELHHKALKIRKKLFGENHEDTARSYSSLGVDYTYTADYDKAIKYTHKCLSILKNVLGEEHTETADTYSNLATLFSSTGDREGHFSNMMKALDIMQRIRGEKHPDTAMIYLNTGGFYSQYGNYETALEYFQRALSIWRDFLGEKHPNIALSYERIGLVNWEMERYDAALKYQKKALAIRVEVQGEDSPVLGNSYNNIGSIYDAMGEYDLALQYFNKSLHYMIKFYGDTHPYTANIYNSIAAVYFHTKQFEKSIANLSKVLEIYRNKFGEEHYDTLHALNNLAVTTFYSGQKWKGLEQLLDTYDIEVRVLGDQNPVTMNTIDNLVRMFEQLGDNMVADMFRQKLEP